MHEAHGPERPIHSVRDFLFHMFTVMLGLLLALGLESIVEWRHHRHLAHQAVENIEREMAQNAQMLDATLSYMPDERKHLEEWLAVGKKIKLGGAPTPGAPPPLKNGWTFNVLASASYRMAHTNGALGYMTFDQASGIATAYMIQDELLANQRDAWSALARFDACFEGLASTQDVSAEDVPCIQGAARDLLARIHLVESTARATRKMYEAASHPH